MTYELAKKLNDAGFPQRFDELRSRAINRDGYYSFYDEHSAPYPSSDYIPVPTLEELIDACGDKFGQLNKADGFWRCFACDPTGEAEFYQDGSTPSEAVANLWLALHDKLK